MHWRTERRITAYWRGQGFAVARAAELPSMDRVRVSAVIHRTRSRKADQAGDAERLKPLLDGIVDAHVVPDDTYLHVEHGSVETVKSTRDGILLIVEALEPMSGAGGSERGEG